MKRAVLAISLNLCMTPAFAGLYTVNLLSDLPDANPGDRKCSAMVNPPPNAAVCTLRAAIQEANLDPDMEISEILVQRGKTYPLTIVGAAEQFAARGDLDIRKPMALIAIGGKDKPRAVINANGLDRVLHFGPAAFGSTVKGVELRGGWASNGLGVAAFIDEREQAHLAEIVFDDVLVRGNKPTSGSGSASACAIELGDKTGMRVMRSEIRENKSAAICAGEETFLATDRVSIHHNTGGGIVLNGHGPFAQIVETAIFRNEFGLRFAAEDNFVEVINSTLVFNKLIQLQASAVESIGLGESLVLAGSVIGSGADLACDLPEDFIVHPGHSFASSECNSVVVADAGLVEFSPTDGRPWAVIPTVGSIVVDTVPAKNSDCRERDVDMLGAERPWGEGCDAGAVELH